MKKKRLDKDLMICSICGSRFIVVTRIFTTYPTTARVNHVTIDKSYYEYSCKNCGYKIAGD